VLAAFTGYVKGHPVTIDLDILGVQPTHFSSPQLTHPETNQHQRIPLPATPTAIRRIKETFKLPGRKNQWGEPVLPTRGAEIANDLMVYRPAGSSESTGLHHPHTQCQHQH